MTKVGIDIGHGNNTFPPSKGFYKGGIAHHEHSFNSKLGARLKEILEAQGIEVVFAQQPNARDIPLGERGDIYREEKVDLVVSLHANWNNNSSVNGRCFFYWHSSVDAKRLATLIRDEVKNAGYDTHGNGLHASVRGTWTDLYITRALPMTSILGEHGFMGGNKDFELIFGNKQAGYVEDMAEANAKGICTFLGVAYKGKSQPVKKPAPGNIYYRVQVGAFKDVANVAAYANQVEKKTGFETYVTGVGGFLKVQLGAFKDKKNAENRLAAVKSKGYKDAFITTESGTAVPETEPRNDHSEDVPKPAKPKKSISQMAQEVLDNKHGNGHENRRKSLGISVSDYEKVRAEVNRRAGVKTTPRPKPKKTVNQMAQEVIDGKHGNGHENRRKSLGISKAEYSRVSAEVNRRLGYKGSVPVKSVSQMAAEVIAGKHGNGHANRRKSLGVSEAVYQQVRKEVNRRS